MKNRNYIILVVTLLIIFSCGLLDNNEDTSTTSYNTVYVALQGLDQVGILHIDSETIDFIEINYDTLSCTDYSSEMDCNMANGCNWHIMETMSHCMDAVDGCVGLNESQCSSSSGCDWTMNMCMESGGIMDMSNHTPHFVVIDKINRYWFVTTITSGYVGRYDLDTNDLIDKIIVGDSPALMVLNEISKKIYVSRMMPMASMAGTVSTIVHEIDYSNPENMTLGNEFIIDSPTPHGLGINSDGSEVYVASNTADWIYKIKPATGEISGKVMDTSIGNSPDIVTQRLKPIQIVAAEDNLLFVTCSAGEWYDYINEEYVYIPGQIQLWDSESMTVLDSLQFDWTASPWHIITSPNSKMVYATLKGDLDYPGSAGVVGIGYESDSLSLVVKNYSNDFQTLHGIDISSDGKFVFVSGRRDGHLHVFNATDLKLLKSIPFGEEYSTAFAGGLKVK